MAVRYGNWRPAPAPSDSERCLHEHIIAVVGRDRWGRCRECRRVRARAHYEANRDAENARSRAYHVAHREAIVARKRARRKRWTPPDADHPWRLR